MEGGGLIGLAIRRPVTVLVCVILVALFGVLSMTTLPIQLTPDISVPTITVRTVWPGAAPSEVEREIVEEQEDVLKNVDGLVRMTSEAADGNATVTMEFSVGTDLDEAMVRVSNQLQRVPDYPAAAREPIIATADASGPPIIVALVQSKHRSDVGPYRTYVEEEVVPILDRVPGVADIRFFGGQDTQIQVEFDPAAVAARGLTIEGVAGAIRAQLGDVSAGDVELSKRRYVVRTLVAPGIAEELDRTVLGVGPDGQVVRLGDVGHASLGLGKPGAYVLGGDTEALVMLFDREAGSNVLEVTRDVRAVMAELQGEKLDRFDLEIRIVSDQVGYITDALAGIRNNILIGGFLAVVVLLVFLRSARSSAVVAIAIPVSILGTALAMALFGRTVNVVSLAGMAFAVGMLVDNSIVVLEAIDAARKRGLGPAQAAFEGTNEVWAAVMASTATTMVVFVPIVLWQDEVGELLRDVALAISIAVFISFVASITVIPSFSAKLLKPLEQSGDDALSRTAGRIKGTLVLGPVRWLSRGAGRSVGFAGGVLGVATIVAYLLMPPLEYLPSGQRNLLFGGLVAPAGYGLEESKSIGRAFQTDVMRHTGVDRDGVPSVERSFYVARPNSVFMGASATDPTRIGELVTWYRGRQQQIPGVFGYVSQASLFGRNIGSSRAIDVELRGQEMQALVAIAGPMMGRLSAALPGSQIRPIPSLDLGAPELSVVPRRETASALGVSPSEIGAMVDALVDGRFVGEYAPDGQPQLDVVLIAQGGGARTPAEIAATPVATASGAVVPLAALATVEETLGPSVISRIERRRALTLQITPPDALSLSEAVDVVRTQVVEPMKAEGAIPTTVDVVLGGSADDLAVAKVRMAWVLLFALAICYLLMAALFEDFVGPLVILATMPLGAVGGILLLRFQDLFLVTTPLDMMTAMGFVILIGTVVNNAILVVDGALARLREGMPLEQATVDAVDRRIRPILMSATTTIAGLAPLVLFGGSGSELYRGIGAVVLGGLGLSTVLTVYVIPAVFIATWRVLRRTT